MIVESQQIMNRNGGKYLREDDPGVHGPWTKWSGGNNLRANSLTTSDPGGNGHGANGLGQLV